MKDKEKIIKDFREQLIAFKNWEVDNDIKNLFPKDVVDLYLSEILGQNEQLFCGNCDKYKNCKDLIEEKAPACTIYKPK